MVPLDLLVTVARALVEVGVVSAQGSLTEGGDLTQTWQSQPSPGKHFISFPESLEQSSPLSLVEVQRGSALIG